MTSGSKPTGPRQNPRLLSFVIPLLNEQENIPKLRAALEQVALRLPCAYEWILIDDGSLDETGSLLIAWAAQAREAKVILFSRRFGQQAALTAGIDHAQGGAVVLMDGDLQDPPELVLAMLEKYREGYDIVYAKRSARQGESWLKLSTANLFYFFMRHFVQRDLPSNTGDFKLIGGEVAQAIRQMREGHRFMRGLTAWIGFAQFGIAFERPARQSGQSKFNLIRLVRLGMDAFLAFSGFPARMATYAGAGLLALAGVLALIGPSSLGNGKLLLLAHAVVGGVILVCLGVIGEYVARIYDELKQRPLYIVRRAVNITLRRMPRAVIPVPQDGQQGMSRRDPNAA